MTADPADDAVLDLVRGEDRARIGVRGASLLGLHLGGLDLIHIAPAQMAPALAAGATLAPWPNRVRGARWRHRGRLLRLEASEPGSGHALHGLVTRVPFRIQRASAAALTLTTPISGHRGYPFSLDLAVTYRLGPRGLRVSTRLRNTGTDTAPVALGAHPYVRLGASALEELTLTVPAATTLLLDDQHLPRERQAVDATAFDLRGGAPAGSMPGHAVYTGFPEGREVVHRLEGPGGALELWADERYRWLQVYRAPCVPDGPGPRAVHRTALALEPMTAPPDALTSGTDLHQLAPGASWKVSWGLRRAP